MSKIMDHTISTPKLLYQIIGLLRNSNPEKDKKTEVYGGYLRDVIGGFLFDDIDAKFYNRTDRIAFVGTLEQYFSVKTVRASYNSCITLIVSNDRDEIVRMDLTQKNGMKRDVFDFDVNMLGIRTHDLDEQIKMDKIYLVPSDSCKAAINTGRLNWEPCSQVLLHEQKM